MDALKLSYLNMKCERQKLDLPSDCRTINIILSNGKYIAVELFEREKGVIEIRAERRLLVLPGCSNSIGVACENF